MLQLHSKKIMHVLIYNISENFIRITIQINGKVKKLVSTKMLAANQNLSTNIAGF